MAKPRVFVSSTYYDLKHIRNNLEAFIDGLGFESVLFEEGDIPFHHDASLDESCYDEINNCHILVLIIGGRYGNPAADQEGTQEERAKFFNSITKNEYQKAREIDIPIYVFIEKNVHSEYHTFKKNRSKQDIEYAHVDDVNIFKLIDEIYAQKRNNLIKDFEKFDDISEWLKDQWAGLFADFLSKKSRNKELEDLSTQISGLKELNSVLKEYSESIMSKLKPANFEQIISSSNESLKHRNLLLFAKNDLIRYLLELSPKGVGTVSMFRSFLKSETLEEMLEDLKFSEINIKRVARSKLAINDYIDLKMELK